MTNPLYRDMANTDFMTELKNRNSYETDRQNLDAKKKWNGLTVAVIDVNNLKLVNDRLGHAVGDDCIVNAARVLQSVESQKVTAYRYGGDEFMVIMKLMKSEKDILKKGEEICHAFSNIYFSDQLTVTASVGIAVWNAEDSAEEAIKRTDMALYRAKTNGKGGCYLWRE